MADKLPPRPVERIVIAHWWGRASDTAEFIDKFYRKMGYLRTPYHFVVQIDGTVEVGRPLRWPGGLDDSKMPDGFNTTSVVVGVILDPKNNHKYHEVQQVALGTLTAGLLKEIGIREIETLV